MVKINELSESKWLMQHEENRRQRWKHKLCLTDTIQLNSGNTQIKYIDIIAETKKGKLNTEEQIVLKWCDTVETVKEDKLSVLKWLLKHEKN